jgi:hypothetical protein
MKKRVLFGLIIYILLCLGIIAFPIIKPQGGTVSGLGVTSAISIFVEREITIILTDPRNTTYNFNIGSTPYTIPLKVYSPNSRSIEKWWYKLEDLRHGETVYEKVIFNPNTTFNAVRWSNKLTVFVNDSTGIVNNASVVFFVSVPNSPPHMEGLPYQLYVCEGNSLSSVFSALDVDEDALSMDINPKNPFFVYPFSFAEGGTEHLAFITSSTIGKGSIGFYSEAITVSDGEYTDTNFTNITAIEINNPPSLQQIGVQTVWSRGDNVNLSIQTTATDLEDGNQSVGNLTFTLSFFNEAPFFSINNSGAINWTGDEAHVGVHNLGVCVYDTGISNISPNISLCNNNGLSAAACKNFSLTVTNENRAPYFVSYSPSTLNISTITGETLSFNVLTRDPDGTVPDIYWHLDDILMRNFTSGNLSDSLSYAFSCNQTGSHIIKVTATDGLINASVSWAINVVGVGCAATPSGGGSGGSGSGGGGYATTNESCKEHWLCLDWNTCQNLKVSFAFANITSKDREDILKLCSILSLDSEKCGFQIRSCSDFNKCKTNYSQPLEIQSCYYSEKPSCFDGIKNCHDGRCEILTDCGGPCNFCPTCSDKIKNQGEEGIDCGGPCPNKCIPESEGMRIFKVDYTLLIITLLILIIVLIIIIKVIQIIKLRKEVRSLAWYKLR